jgi:membrane protein
MNKFKYILKGSLKEYFKPVTLVSVNSIAFSLLMSLAPMIALLTVFSLRFLQTKVWVQDEISNIIPQNIVSAFIDVGLETDSFGFIPFITALIVSIYVASKGFRAIILTFTELNTVELNVLHIRISSLIAPFVFCLFTIILVGTISFLQLYLPNLILLNSLISFGVDVLLCFAFYYLTIYPRKKVKYYINGTIVMAIGLTIMSNFFMFAINNFFNYNDVYGSLAYLLILLLAVFWVSMIIYFGNCVNLSTSRYYENN